MRIKSQLSQSNSNYERKSHNLASICHGNKLPFEGFLPKKHFSVNLFVPLSVLTTVISALQLLPGYLLYSCCPMKIVFSTLCGLNKNCVCLKKK